MQCQFTSICALTQSVPILPTPGASFINCCLETVLHLCSKWGGAESRGSGARPVELMIMSDTCATHRSRVPRRSSGRIKGGAMPVEDERGPGLDFILCFVCGSRP